MIQHILDTPLGWFRVIGNETHIIAAQWISEEDAIVGSDGGNVLWKREVERQVAEYFNGRRNSFTLPLAPAGSTFQQRVWDALTEIPIGTTESYKTIAERLQNPEGSLAVGKAAGENPVLLLIPCHRLIGSDGELTGYAAGLEHKEWLLEHEGALQPQQLRLF